MTATIVIKMTIEEIHERGWWEEYCQLTSTNVYAWNEGQVQGRDEVILPKELTTKYIKEELNIKFPGQ